ncbi:MAG: hypothetical protein ACJ788_26325 [Ktedonobacteraceae bacterium]
MRSPWWDGALLWGRRLTTSLAVALVGWVVFGGSVCGGDDLTTSLAVALASCIALALALSASSH